MLHGHVLVSLKGASNILPMSSDRLTRELTLPAAAALVVGQVIAVGIFLTPGAMIRTLASPLLILLVWVLIGAMAICGALCYGALAARFPRAGGGYVYLREVYGPRVAFLYGWKCFLVMDPGISAALATGFATYLGTSRDSGQFLCGWLASPPFCCSRSCTLPASSPAHGC